MKTLRFAMIGTGFWSRYQLAGWRELPGVECVALYNRTRARAEAVGREFGITAIYDDAAELLANEDLDFVDVVTDPETHVAFSLLALDRGLPVICQKPLAPSLPAAEELVNAFAERGIPLLVNENWRWQRPIRQLSAILNSGLIGRVWRARLHYDCSFPVFENQPLLRELDRFILTDMGAHLFDAARFLFGEAKSLVCHTHRVNPETKGEDAATVLVEMESAATLLITMSYASRMEHERFPQTFVVVEGEDASAELGPDYWLRVTDVNGTHSERVAPPRYPWADSRYEVVNASIPVCQENLLAHLRGEGTAETTGEDNLRTLRMLDAAYASAEQGGVRVGMDAIAAQIS